MTNLTKSTTPTKELFDSLQLSSKLNEFAVVEQIANFRQELSIKPYYIRYKELFYVCVGLSLLAQTASIISSYAYFRDIFSVAITQPYLLVVMVGVILIVIEVLKRLLLQSSLQSWFGLQRIFSPIPSLLAVILSVLSMYASVIGGGTLGVDVQKELTTTSTHHTQTDSIARHYDKQIGILRAEIQAIAHRNTYKGTTYLPKKEKELVHLKEGQLVTLLQSQATAVKQAQQKAAQALLVVQITNEAHRKTYQFWFLGFECLFLACMVFVYDYKRKVVLETLLQEQSIPPQNPQTTASTPEVTTAMPSQGTTTHYIPTSSPSKIGFVFGKDLHLAKNRLPSSPNEKELSEKSTALGEKEGHTRNCLHCGNSFTYKHWNKQYCTESCKIQAWNKRTGKTFTKRKR